MGAKSTAGHSGANRTRVVAYLRVSTEKQADKGVSLAAQRAKVTAYAELFDLEIAEVVVDRGVSASSLDRPGLDRALGMLGHGGVTALLVVKLDRLTRSVRDLGDLVERYFASGRYALLSVGEQIDTRTAGGRLVLNVLGSVSQWEREAIGERTSAAMRHMADQGEYTGGRAPYGFEAGPDGRLVPVRSEQACIKAARAAHARGLSLRQVSAHLATRGYRTRSGRPFLPVQVARMLA